MGLKLHPDLEAKIMSMADKVDGQPVLPGAKTKKAKRAKPKLIEARFESPCTFWIPLQVFSGDNFHAGTKARTGRAGHERKVVAHQLARRLGALAVPATVIQSGHPLKVKLIRLGGRGLDRWDGLPSSMKYVLDTVCLFLGVDDANPKLRVDYDQEPGGDCGVKVELNVE